MYFCRLHLCLPTSNPRRALCFVARPWTRALHIRHELAFIWLRINAIVSASVIPNWSKMASNGVRSSHAISTMRSICHASNFFTTAEPFMSLLSLCAMHKKPHLPEKVCATCGRPFTWRKKWEKNWAEVKYCSKRCSGNRR
jgi:hypothetical protein